MKSIRGKKLSTWKAIIVSDIHTGVNKRFELDENQRLIEKIKPDRRTHIPQQFIKIRITKDIIKKHQELNKILDYMIARNKKIDDKANELTCCQNDQKQLLKDQETSGEDSESLYKDLIDQFFINPDDNDNAQDNEFIPPNELSFTNF